MNKIIILSCFLFILSNIVIAQGIEGRVINNLGDPLFPATIKLKGKAVGAATNIDGYFTLKNVKTTDTLLVRFIGYEEQVIPVYNKTFISVLLRPSTAFLDEIIVTGYKIEKKKEITGAISKIKGEELKNNQSHSLERLLQGKAAGLLIKGTTGIPGGESWAVIRGFTSINSGTKPLFIVDGIPIDPLVQGGIGLSISPFSFLNPEDIESIEVLKDAASTSVYGAQAANGVILITTKKGKTGKTRFNFSTYQGVNTRLKDLELMSSQELVRFRMLQYKNDAQARGFDAPVGRGIWNGLQHTGFDFSPYSIATFKDVEENIPQEIIDQFIDTLPTHDWFDVPYRNGHVQNYQVSAMGGSESTQYFSSFSFNKTASHIKNTDFQQAKFRLNLDHKASDKIELNTTLSLSSNKQKSLDWNWAGVSPIQSGNTFPWNPVLDDFGNYQEPILGKPFNPLKHIELNSFTGTNNQLLGALSLQYQLFPTLSYKGTYGLDYYDYLWEFWLDPRTYLGGFNNGWRSIDNHRKFNQTTTHLLQFTPEIGKNQNLNAMLVWEYRDQKVRDHDVAGENFPNELFRTLDAAGNAIIVAESSSKFSYLGTLMNLKYALHNRYFINGSIRYDGSSRFGESRRFGWFPSLSASWRISEENFFGWDFINDLKLRVGWGTTGNSLISDFASRGLAVAGGNYMGSPGIYLQQLANEQLGWEQQKEWNIGVDYDFWKHRISGSLELYRRITSDILLNRDLVPSSSFYSIKENLGRLRNNGIELSLNAYVLNFKDLRWENRFNLALQGQELLELYSGKENEGEYLQVGEELWIWYMYDYAGINPANGRSMWYDHAGNLTYNPKGGDNIGAPNDDRKVFKTDTPNIFGGLNSALSFRGFTLSAFFSYEFGRMGKETLDNYYLDTNNPNVNHSKELWEDAWLEPGDLARWPIPGIRPLPGFSKNFISTTVQKIDYIRLKELNLTYDLPDRWLKKWKVNKANIFIQGTNLLTFTNYTGLDPEFAGSFSNLSYPLGKSYTAGLEIGF